MRPIQRGKRPNPTEFGQKLHLSVVDEYTFLEQTSWFNFNEGCDLLAAVEDFHRKFGHYPEAVLSDKIYQTRDDLRYCKELPSLRLRYRPRRAHDLCQRQAVPLPQDGTGEEEPVRQTEEYYQCEDCTGCPYRERCHKSKEDRIVRINEELTRFHEEVLTNLNCIHGALLRMNRSIQSEGTYGGIKWNRGYKRLRRRGIEGVILELGLISCGFNLHKFHLKKLAARNAA